MNSLSWFIYFADVVGTLSVLFTLVGIVSLAVSVVSLIIKEKINSFVAYFAISSAFLFLVATLIPSKQTLYAIAASEIGEEILKSEEGKQVINALKEYTLSFLKTGK